MSETRDIHRVEVTQRDEFECSYIFEDIEKGYELHSHRYRIEVTVSAPQRQLDFGMVIEFRKFKNLLKKVLPDGKFLYKSARESEDSYCCKDPGIRTVVEALEHLGIEIEAVTCDLTAESLCEFLANSIQRELNVHEPGVRVDNVKLRENNDSFASWSRT